MAVYPVSSSRSSLGLCLALVHLGKVARKVAEAVNNLGKEHWIEELVAGVKGTRVIL